MRTIAEGNVAERSMKRQIIAQQYNVDVCIVGGGIAGLTVAAALSRLGATVAVVERGKIDGGAARVAAGMLAPLVEARLAERDVVEFGRDSLRYWPEFVHWLEAETEMSVDYRTEGTLVVGVERDHIAAIRHLHDEQQELGLPVEQLSGYECRKLEPYLAPVVPAGIFSPHDHQVDNRLLLAALIQFCRNGPNITLLEECGLGTVQKHGVAGNKRGGKNSYQFRAANIEVNAPTLVVATGASLAVLADIAPQLTRLVRPVKGQIVRLDQSGMKVLDHVVRTPEMYMAPKSDGTLVLGASSEDRGFDSAITLGPLFELFRAAWECLPAVYELPVIETAVGFRPASIDHAPLLGETELDRLFLATGYYRHGILFAPLAAELLARKILENNNDERLNAFSPKRFGAANSVNAEVKR